MTDLEQWFCEYRHKYFGKSLKPCRVFYRKMEPLGLFGSYRVHGARSDGGAYYIAISNRIRWSSALVRMTLLHEMVHLKLVDKDKSPKTRHSRMFHREMKRLAARGAFVGLW